MSACCSEPGCRRRTPYRIRLAPLSGRWTLIVRWHLKTPPGGTIPLLYADERHDIDGELRAALIDAGWTPPVVP